MVQDRICKNCGVEVSDDLCNCPLCGKYMGEFNYTKNKNSYPIYDLKNINTARWYNIIRAIFWTIGILCVIVNLVFKTSPYWFPYAIAGFVMIFHVFIETVKNNVKSYIKNLSIMSVLMAIFVLFIDAYNHYAFNIEFGWALAYVAPMIMMAGVLASGIICLSTKLYEAELLRRVTFLSIISIIYFLIKIFYFKNLPTWPSLVFMAVSVGMVVILELLYPVLVVVKEKTG